MGTDHFEIGCAPLGQIGRVATPDHVHVDLSDDRVARDRRMIGIPRRSEQPALLSRVRNEQDRPSRSPTPHQRAGDLEQRHRSRSIVVCAVEHGIRPGPVRRAQAVAHGLHPNRLGRCGRPHRRVGPHRTDHAIEGVGRVMIDRPARESYVIVMGAERNVFPAQHRIASRQDRDHVAGGVGECRPNIADLPVQRIAELRRTRGRWISA